MKKRITEWELAYNRGPSVTDQELARKRGTPVTERELEILKKRAAGFTFLQVAFLLDYHKSVVRSDEQSACEKLGITSKGALRLWQIQAYLEKLQPPTMADECF